MPTYDYACDKCKTVWEVRHGMSENPEIECECGAIARKCFSPPNFYFRGNYLLNKQECKKNMDIHAMEVGNDPYKEHRVPGEKEHVIQNLKNQKTAQGSGYSISTEKQFEHGTIQPCISEGCPNSTSRRCPACGSPVCTRHHSCPKCK